MSDRPRDLVLNRILQADAEAAQLYSMLPQDVQAAIQQRAEDVTSVKDIERIADEYNEI